jgi:hypothetical protein
MKLFIWDEAYSVPYGSSIGFCVADSLDEAKAIMRSQITNAEVLAQFEQKEPSQIEDCPHGQFYEWSE